MVLGFISLILSFTQSSIVNICIPVELADTMLPCALRKPKYPTKPMYSSPPPGHKKFPSRRHLLQSERRFLAADTNNACESGYVPLISQHGLHQLHIFIFFLAVFHVIYSVATMMLGRMKIRKWKEWEKMATDDPDYADGSTKFRLTHETSFVRAHSNSLTRSPLIFYIVSFLLLFSA